MTRWVIRTEQPGDEPAIHAVNEAAFANHPHSEGTEPAIVDRLRRDGDLTLSLIARNDAGQTVGHAAFSAAILDTGETGWEVLGPIAVLPSHHGQGVARAMLAEAERILRDRGAKGIVLLGDPALYARLGFTQDTPLHITGPLAAYFHARHFSADVPGAAVSFAPAFRLARVKDR